LRTAADWLAESDKLEVRDGRVRLTVPAGGVRIIELR
jgi:hypothetical protein